MPTRNLSVLFLAGIVSLICYGKAPRNRYASVIVEAMGIVERNSLQDVEQRELFENAMNGMLSGLDEHSTYIGRDQFSRFREMLDQEFGGIGIMVEADPETGLLTVLSPLVGTPAHRAGMRSGDVIVAIDGHDAEGMKLDDAVTLMRGRKGTPIHLTVRHRGETDTVPFELVREIIPVESVLGDTRRADGSWNFYLPEEPRIGYIRLTSFGEHTAEQLQQALRFDRHPIQALVIDVRDNAGGLLTAAVDVCDMFLDGGPIVSTRGRGGVLRDAYSAKPGTALSAEIPVVVLVNHHSASASEIVASCLQDDSRAAVVGQRTWGKGTVQVIVGLEGGRSALKITTASYWRPSGKNINRGRDAGPDDEWGVQPDDGLEVILTDEEAARLARYRQMRDLPPESYLPPSPDVESPGTEAPSPDSPPTTVDPQLRRAVEYLQQQLDAVRVQGKQAAAAQREAPALIEVGAERRFVRAA